MIVGYFPFIADLKTGKRDQGHAKNDMKDTAKDSSSNLSVAERWSWEISTVLAITYPFCMWVKKRTGSIILNVVHYDSVDF